MNATSQPERKLCIILQPAVGEIKKQVFCEWIRDHGDHPVGVGTTGTNSTLNNLSPNTVVNNIYSIYSKYVQPKVKLLNLNYSACRKSKKFFLHFIIWLLTVGTLDDNRPARVNRTLVNAISW